MTIVAPPSLNTHDTISMNPLLKISLIPNFYTRIFAFAFAFAVISLLPPISDCALFDFMACQ